MRLSWNGEGQKYYPNYEHIIMLKWWQVPPPIDSRKPVDLKPVSRYVLTSNKNNRTILLNISVKGYTLYAGKEKT